MPAFLEKKLKAEYGNKPTAKGKPMERKNERKVSLSAMTRAR